MDTSSLLGTIEERFVPGQHLNTETANATTLSNVFTNLDIERGGYTVNHRTNTVTQTVTVTNRDTAAAAGPVQLVLDNLSSNTTLKNAAGTTANNPPASPYITVSSGNLAPGATAAVTLQFTLPASGGVTYSARTVTGSNP